MRKSRGLGAAAALCLSLTGFGLLPPIPASAADLTVRGVSAWNDPLSGIVHVVGEVLNNGAVNYQTVMVSCNLVDAGGTTLTDAKSIEADILMPNEKAPFDTLFFTGAGSHSPTCGVSGAPTSFQPDHNFTAVITAVQFPGDGSQHVVGTLTNNNTLNTVAATNIRVILTSYDPGSPGTVIDEGVAWVDGPVSANGGTATFDLNANTTRHWDTNPAHSATLSEAPSPAVVLSTDRIAFPDQVQGTVSAEQLLYLRNIGTGDLTFASIPTFGGSFPGDFSRADDLCSGATVKPGAACSMGITFAPTAQVVVARSATLSIHDNANGSPGVVSLSGNGLARPSIALGATSVEFGLQMVGTSGHTVIQLTSNGLDPASISSILVDNTTDFGVDGSACLLNDIPPSSACQINLAFHPQFDGPLNGTLTIRSNARQDPVTIPLSGTGTHAVPGATLSTPHLTFPSQSLGTTSPSQMVTLTNGGTGSLTISSIVASGDFGRTTTCGSTLAAGSTCGIAVTFAPTSAGAASGTLTVTDNAGSGSQTVSLSGTGSTETDFYFAEGFTGPGFQERLSLIMPTNDGQATIDYFLNGAPLITKHVALVRGQTATVNVNDAVGPNQEVSIRVRLPFPGVAERILHFQLGAWHGSTDIVGTSTPSSEWDFAEGSTLGFFSEYLTLQNPNGVAVPATLSYMTDSGTHPSKTVTLPANSRTTVGVFNGDPNTTVPSCNPNGAASNCGVGPGIGGVAVKITTPDGEPIVAERPFYVNGFSFGSGPIHDGHVAFGANGPATQWNFAEGTTLPGFNEYLTLQNPDNTTPALVTLRYIDQSANVTTRMVTVNPLSRVTVEVWKTSQGVGPGIAGVSTQVTSSTVPIVAERPMYIVHDFGSGPVAGATDVVGSTALSTLFGFASATTISGESDFLTIQNPSRTTAARVHITYYTTLQTFPRDVTVNPNTRLTIPISSAVDGALGPGYAGVGIVILSEQPVLVERPTYSANADTYGATDTLGYSPPNF